MGLGFLEEDVEMGLRLGSLEKAIDSDECLGSLEEGVEMCLGSLVWESGRHGAGGRGRRRAGPGESDCDMPPARAPIKVAPSVYPCRRSCRRRVLLTHHRMDCMASTLRARATVLVNIYV